SKDINQGLQSGRFKVKADDFILNLSILSGMLISVTGDLYKGHLKPSTLSSIAARSLLQLGLDPDEAEKVADSCTVKIPAQELPLSSYDLEIVKYETKATETLRAI
ncbi:MAG: hypothetical protein HRU08_13775, partial [Oleispira sp.]|nr:hypothetical protein [Oleispira sp.]